MQNNKLEKEDWLKIYPYMAQAGMDGLIDFFVEKCSSPIGYSKFLGDEFKLFGDMDKLFEKGKTYPVYDDSENLFVIGNDGKSYKLTPPKSWTKITDNDK